MKIIEANPNSKLIILMDGDKVVGKAKGGQTLWNGFSHGFLKNGWTITGEIIQNYAPISSINSIHGKKRARQILKLMSEGQSPWDILF